LPISTTRKFKKHSNAEKYNAKTIQLHLNTWPREKLEYIKTGIKYKNKSDSAV